ncbi:replication protein A 32 kDa subunit B-like [Phoenix dactylifera]|uniref:Replication protein A 32 kDa subunit B-like n=1 Tax=Phoenix dactylifera TaxID=42345 RepID=A0A8B8ZST3_PHODC|nr:replication protein A 32 kDa subunit B-like [Phoenix dactylifera]XP_038974490.1 replication protein A 32 kDa subunit B-like [Phoenix dactylifera]
MYGSQFDGGASLFSGGGFMPSQATQTPDSTFSKSRGAQGVLPLTVKQISEAYHSNDDKSNFVVDGVDASNVRLRGLVMNKVEKVTDVTFTLDDGTGRIEVHRWVNETTDTNEMALVQNGMYVTINGSLKGFQGKKHVVAFSVRPVIDFNEITLHFIECIHVHLENTRPKVLGSVPPQAQANPLSGTVTPTRAPVSKQFSTCSSSSGSDTDVYKLVLDVFQEPANLAREHGLHVDEVARRLGLPMEKIKDAIDYHVDVGHIYSTIDDNHYKSACNG